MTGSCAEPAHLPPNLPQLAAANPDQDFGLQSTVYHANNLAFNSTVALYGAITKEVGRVTDTCMSAAWVPGCMGACLCPVHSIDMHASAQVPVDDLPFFELMARLVNPEFNVMSNRLMHVPPEMPEMEGVEMDNLDSDDEVDAEVMGGLAELPVDAF